MGDSQFVIEDGVLTKYLGAGGQVVIPEGVRQIGMRVFEGCKGLTGIQLPPTLVEIGNSAFRGCKNLKQITVPQGVKRIGVRAFYRCDSLRQVDLPEGLAEIGDYAFADCVSLGSIQIAQGAVCLSTGLFWGCSHLTQVTIGDGAKKIGNYAFFDCGKLTAVQMPGSVTQIGKSAFAWCQSLAAVQIPSQTERIEKSVFEGSRPDLIAPHIPIEVFDKEDKPGAICGFARVSFMGQSVIDYKKDYLDYIQAQKEGLYPLAVRRQVLLRLLFAERMIPRQDIDLLLEECDRQKNITAKAAVLDYAGKSLQPVDLMKEFEL